MWTHSFSVPLAARAHVLTQALSLLGGGLQPLPQLLDVCAVGSTQGLVLRLTALQLHHNATFQHKITKACTLQGR